MEQIIETFGIDWKLIVVQLFNFGLLLVVLWYVLYRPLVALIEKRRTQIIESVAHAERAEAAMKDAGAKRAEIIAAAGKEAEGIVADARTAGKEVAADIQQKAQEAYERTLAEAEMKGEELKRHALQKSKEEIAQMVVLGVAKTMKETN
jgi:F-type H+-transporting ATPase subunit b